MINRIEHIASTNAIHPAKTWAHAYAEAARIFTISGIYYNGFRAIKEAVDGNKIVYSIAPSNTDDPTAKIYFIF